MRRPSSPSPYYCCLLLLLFFFSVKTGAFSIHNRSNHNCNSNDLGALYGFSRSLDTQIHEWPVAITNSTNCCSWPGVHCALFSTYPTSSSSSFHSSLVSNARVVGLDLPGKGLEGVLSPSLSGLDKLSFLNLSLNSFRGPIRPELFHQKLLAVIDLSNNHLSGEMPPGIGNLSSLSLLDISNNRFTGMIPDVFHGLKKLEVFSADCVGFVGLLPTSLSSCSMLTSLDLWNNSLNGSIDLHFGRLLRLTVLNLGSNRFHGLIPESLSSCKALQILNLNRNNLSGLVPQKLRNLCSLSFLALEQINLSKTLTVLQGCHNLTVLSLTQNFRNEEMPTNGIRGFGRLRALSNANCGFKGSMPLWLRKCRELRAINLAWTHFSGEIPSWFGGFDHLFVMDLSSNSFYGEIPISLMQLKSLTLGKSLQDDVSSLEPPLYYWHRGKQINETLLYKHYTDFPPMLNFSRNKLNGSIWKEFEKFKYLHHLDLSWNNFSGSIPEELSNMINIEKLDLSFNNLSGSIPSSLTRLTFLSFFSAAYNHLQGLIPSGGQFSSFEGNPGLYSNPKRLCNSTLNTTDHEEGDDNAEDKFVFLGLPFAIGLVVGFLPTVSLVMCCLDDNYNYD
ncbi:hypothetical protein C4D60_Mb05t16140 [Musa balbisiana]|uniref:Leucine-rich repeat-containing N-terminal plant-type domain-containing protein n=1 Tax=Musa balbisiana TaxID=52838 RepID=A0A4S8JWJ2_MUSBA|nr:hypothetical protein C4D60_Mb05t16140 [Musa balbisiana]